MGAPVRGSGDPAPVPAAPDGGVVPDGEVPPGTDVVDPGPLGPVVVVVSCPGRVVVVVELPGGAVAVGVGSGPGGAVGVADGVDDGLASDGSHRPDGPRHAWA